MQLYRIENKKNGKGPYQNGLCTGGDYYNPGPNQDGVFGSYDDYYDACRKGVAEKYYYAFPSIKHMTEWFREDSVRRFLKKGCVIVKFEVPKDKLLIGDKQVAFKPKDMLSKKYWVPVREVYQKAA